MIVNKSLTLIVTVFVISAFATTYYIDNSLGGDSNNGTFISSPLKSLEAISNLNLVAGDSVLLKKGEIWKSEKLEISNLSGNSSSNIIFSSYPNEGDLPIITTIRDTTLTWVAAGADRWSAELSYNPERLFIDGVEILRANSPSELDGINFLWYSNEDSEKITLSLEDNPSSHRISFTNSSIGIILEDSKNIEFSNIEVRGGWTSIFINGDINGVTFKSMKIGGFASNGITINSDNSVVPQNILIDSCRFDALFTLDYSMAGNYRGSDDRGCSDGIFVQAAKGVLINNSYFKNWGHASVDIAGEPDNGTDVKVSDVDVFNNYMISEDICYGGRIGLDDATECEIYNNYLYKTSVQTQINGFNNHVHHNIFAYTTNPPIIDINDEISAALSIESYSSTDIHDVIIENNLFIESEGAGLRFTNSGSFDIFDNIIRNNIFYNCGKVEYEKGIAISIEQNTDDCIIRNNYIQNNLIFNAEYDSCISIRGAIITSDSLNLLGSQDGDVYSDNINGDPMFISISNRDYHLKSSSTAIDNGITPLSTKDYDGNTISFNGSDADIGIYEFQGDVAIIERTLKNNSYKIVRESNSIIVKSSSKTKIKNISLYEFNGKVIANNIIPNRKFVTSTLAKGVYLLKVTESIYTKTFLISNL
jgi:hypothetical protein